MCLCVCLCRLLQLLKDESSASKSFYRILVMFINSWICKIMLRSAAINLRLKLLASIVFNNNHGRSLPTL